LPFSQAQITAGATKNPVFAFYLNASGKKGGTDIEVLANDGNPQGVDDWSNIANAAFDWNYTTIN
jgi:hypothetical protein